MNNKQEKGNADISDMEKQESYAEVSPPKIKFNPEKIAKILEKQKKNIK